MPLPQEELIRRAARIRLVIFDVDGVLTDGTLTYGSQGELAKTFHTRDGHGMVLLREAGIPPAILSARNSEIVRTRMREISVRYVIQASRDKTKGFAELLAKTGLKPEEAAFMGDDVNDLPVLLTCGLSATPADGADVVREKVHFIAKSNGGKGAARELCELILKAQDKWHPEG